MSTKARIRVMLVDDHPIVRSGLKNVLEASGRLKVVGVAGDGEEAVSMVEELKPEVIVMDVMMPRKDGIEACREIMELLPDIRVLMLTASPQMDAVIEAVAAGATGYLQKYSEPDELVDAIVDVAKGRVRMSKEAVKEVFAILRTERNLILRKASDRLTQVEQVTLTMFASGRSYTKIAEARDKSVTTVRNTLYRIQDKLGVKTKQELVVWAVRNGFVDEVCVGR